jgi:hypothetical protein
MWSLTKKKDLKKNQTLGPKASKCKGSDSIYVSKIKQIA